MKVAISGRVHSPRSNQGPTLAIAHVILSGADKVHGTPGPRLASWYSRQLRALIGWIDRLSGIF